MLMILEAAQYLIRNRGGSRITLRRVNSPDSIPLGGIGRALSRLSIGIDVGGTFTDIVVHDSEKDEVEVVEVATTPDDPSEAILSVLSSFGSRAAETEMISHATTIATNALLTHTRLAETALITNHGFRDILEIARQRRPELYNLR